MSHDRHTHDDADAVGPPAPALPTTLPRLRRDLDVMSSPVEDQPGLLIRDPYQYSGETLIIPTALVPLLRLLDGVRTSSELVRATAHAVGDHDADEVARGMIATLSEAGFLDDAAFADLRRRAHATFADAKTRAAAHAGSGYPGEHKQLHAMLTRYLDDGRRALLSLPRPPRREQQRLLGLAAPHVSPAGGSETYGAAYHGLPDSLADKTFVLLGTSHYGEPDRFGLTHKPFITPLGTTVPDTDMLTALAEGAPKAIVREDYCHAVEHSLEFQVIFLQHLFGPEIRIAPILCGPFSDGAGPGKTPEAHEGVAAFIDTLGNWAAREGDKLFFVAGVDMAHIGRRYGDAHRAQVHRGAMQEVATRDQARLACLQEGDAGAFWTAIHEQGDDDLRWCGSAPLYTLARALPQARSRLLRYDQWNIDEDSVVSFAALRFAGVD